MKKKKYTAPVAYAAKIRPEGMMTAMSVCSVSLNGWGTETELGANTADSDGDVFVGW